MINLTATQLAALTTARVCDYESTLKELVGERAKIKACHYQKFRNAVRKAHKSNSLGDLKRAEDQIRADADHCVDPIRRRKLLGNLHLLSIYSDSFARPFLPFAFEAPGLREGLGAVVEGIAIRYTPHLAVLSKGLRPTYIHLFCDQKDNRERQRTQLCLIAEILKSIIPDFHPNQLVGYLCHTGKKIKAGHLSSVDRHRLQAVARQLKFIGII